MLKQLDSIQLTLPETRLHSFSAVSQQTVGDMMTENPSVLVLSGTCGSGKSTIAGLVATRAGWCRVSEDDIWPRHFGKDRGAFGTAEHRQKRGVVHGEVLERVRAARRDGLNVVIDATIHEARSEALR